MEDGKITEVRNVRNSLTQPGLACGESYTVMTEAAPDKVQIKYAQQYRELKQLLLAKHFSGEELHVLPSAKMLTLCEELRQCNSNAFVQAKECCKRLMWTAWRSNLQMDHR